MHIGGNNTVGEDERLYSIISDPSSELEELYMGSTKLTSNVANKLFVMLNDTKKLKILCIDGNNITDEACDAIVMAVKKNVSLVKLHMHYNPISGECAQLIVPALQHNNTLQQLYFPRYSDYVEKKIRRLAAEVIKKRESYSCQVKLEMRC